MEDNNHQKNILHIHYYFPPVGTVGTLRNYNLVKELSNYFDTSHLITIRNKPLLMEESFNFDFIQEHEVSNFDYRNLYEKYFKKKDLNDQVNARKGKSGLNFITRLLDSYPGNILWGEGGLIYINAAINKAKKLIKTEGITHIYTSFRPFADHFIGYRLKKDFPQLIWIADFRDLPVDNNRKNVFFPELMDKQYKRLFSRADLLITVSEGLRKRLLVYNDQVIVVRSGLRRLFLPINPIQSEIFTITYTGSLYPTQQNPEPLFTSIQTLIKSGAIEKEKIRLVYAGKDHRIWRQYIEKYKLEEISTVVGKVSLTESIKLQHESHVNVLLTWNGPFSGGVITGKLSEYLVAGRPILCLIKGGRDDEMEAILGEIKTGFISYSEDRETLSNWLEERYKNKYETNKDVVDEKEFKINQFDWEKEVQKLVAQLT